LFDEQFEYRGTIDQEVLAPSDEGARAVGWIEGR
jgi:hypothetical protein